MCGINGIVRLGTDGPPVGREELLRTRDAMALRGPDGHGQWVSDDEGVAFGHRRLAIIDLSDAGLQPMSGAGGRLRIVFNGEIYNYRELRDELTREGVRFRTQTDTEVILVLYEREGIDMLRRLRGMYALAIWDERDRSLVLARDPYGIKPLYYTSDGAHLRFASQVRALLAGGAISPTVDPAGLVGFLLWGSVPEPMTIYGGVHSLPAGHYLRVADGKVEAPRAFYRFDHVELVEDADVVGALEDSVRAHLVADVPVAVFLSAGLDSTLLASLAARYVAGPLSTLTLRFEEYAGTPEDEAPLAAEVAKALGAHHVQRDVRREDFLRLWPDALAAMDQPSIDGLNTYVVSRVAHDEGIKVVLSGLGGDELFGSYPSFRDVPRWARWVGRLRHVPGLQTAWPHLAGRVAPSKPKLAGMLEYAGDLAGAYYVRHALYLPDEVRDLVGPETARAGLEAYDPVADAGKFLAGTASAPNPRLRGPDARAWEAVHVMESTQFMKNQLLRDCDWASMAHSLELRVPLVDARLRSRLASAGFEPGRTEGKAAVVRRAAPELPPGIWDRPKSGFGIPVMQWLDETGDAPRSAGEASRRLALEVLRGFGVELEASRRSRVDVA